MKQNWINGVVAALAMVGIVASLACGGKDLTQWQVRRLNKSAAAGDVDAMKRLAEYSFHIEDDAAAYSWLERAARRGDAQAAFSLYYHLKDSNNPHDSSRAMSYLQVAAQREHAPAQETLGSMYLEGKKVQRDENEGRFWLTKSAFGGDIDGVLKLCSLALDSGEVATAQDCVDSSGRLLSKLDAATYVAGEVRNARANVIERMRTLKRPLREDGVTKPAPAAKK